MAAATPTAATPTAASAARLKLKTARAELAARMIERDDEIDACLTALVAGEHVLLVGPPGCLAGDTLIQIHRAGNGRAVRIDDLVKRLSGDWSAGGPSWDLSIPTMVARADRGRVRLGRLKNAWSSGMKETFVLRTVGGRSIRATADHPFLTDDGVFVRLGDLRPGYGLQVDAGRGRGGRVRKEYRDRYTRFHPRQRKAKDGYRTPEHHLVVEAAMNGMGFDDFLSVLRSDPVRAAAMSYLPSGTVVHHKDRNHLNNAVGNLEVLTDQAAHATEHADQSTDNVLSRIGIDRVFSVSRHGEEETYDIEVEDDPHCFMANGFAVHNTGKSMLCNAVAELIDGKPFTYLMTKFTAPEELFGPVSLTQLKADRYVRVTTDRLPEADVAFLDEVFKSSSAILNTILTILNERTFNAGTGPRPVPLRVCVGASNEWPSGDGQQELGALFDRFVIRRTVRPIASAAGKRRLRFDRLRHAAPLTVRLTPAELDAARAAAAALPWTDEAMEAFDEIIRGLNREGIFPGDRREYKAVGIAQAAAFLDGADRVEPAHLTALADVLWDSPEGQPAKCHEVVNKVANPAGHVVSTLMVEAEQIIAATDTRSIAAVTAAAQKLSEINQKLSAVKGSPKADKAAQFVRDRVKAMKTAALDVI